MQFCEPFLEWASRTDNSNFVRTIVALLAIPGALVGIYMLFRRLSGRSPEMDAANVAAAQVAKILTAPRNAPSANERHSYDWYSSIGHRDFSSLKIGSRVLYEEAALLPGLDQGERDNAQSAKLPPPSV